MTYRLLTEEGLWGERLVEEPVLGAPCRVFADRRRHLGDLFDDARAHPSATYLVQGARRLTFAAHEGAVGAVRRVLEARGVGPSDTVMILGANSVELVVSFWAVIRAGAIAVLGNAWWSSAEVAHGLSTVEPRLVIVDARREPLLPAGTARLGFGEVGAVVDGARPEPDAEPAPVAEDDPAVVIFTSGTTGLPKGALLSHRGVLATLQSLLVVTRRLPPRPPERARSIGLLSLPLFHIGGLAQILTPMVVGTTLVFTEGRFDPHRVADLIEAESVTAWSAVPTMVARLIAHLEDSGRELPGLRTLGMGGAVVDEEIRERARRSFPNARRGIGVTYGLTESGGAVTTAAGEAVAARPGCVGRLLPGQDVRIAAPGPEGDGEILVRSPAVMLRYCGDEADGLVVDPDRWLHTGDIGRLDDDGFLFVTGRQKDVIIRGGENIAGSHVEAALSGHPDVAEVAVVGLPHPELGEEVGAVVVLRPGAESGEADLTQFAAASLAYFELPSAWWFHDGPLPQNATGKILKRNLRDAWVTGRDRGRGRP